MALDKIQAYLYAEGLLTELTGRYDRATQRAIAIWHYRRGLPITYQPTKALRQAANAAAKAAREAETNVEEG